MLQAARLVVNVSVGFDKKKVLSVSSGPEPPLRVLDMIDLGQTVVFVFAFTST